MNCQNTLSNSMDNEAIAVVPSNKEKFNKNSHRLKQSEKINAVLKSSDCRFSTIQEMKDTIFEAWNTVKKEELKIQKKHKLIDKNVNSLCSYCPTSKGNASKSYRDAEQNQPLASHEVLKSNEKEMKYSRKSASKPVLSAGVKKQKEKLKKDEKQGLSSDKQETYTAEEREMIFKSWKKKKDETIKQQRAQEESLEKQRKFNLLMEQENKKAMAELAYSSWVTHKEAVNQREKLENLEREKFDNELKLQRDREALEMYFLWLENKNAIKQNETNKTEKKLPWVPPGISSG